jgi:hypothetical protein
MKRFAIAAAMGAVLPVAIAQTPAPRTTPKGIFTLENSLGVAADIQPGGCELASKLRDRLVCGYGNRFPVRLADNFYATFGVWLLKEASISKGVLKVELNDGTVFQGRAEGEIRVSGTSEVYSVASIVSLKPKEVTPGWDKLVSAGKIYEKSDHRWTFKLTSGPRSETREVSYLYFGVQYYSTQGYALGGAEQVSDRVNSLRIDVAGEIIQTPLTAFDRIEIFKGTGSWLAPQVKVRAPNGKETTGKLVLEGRDGKGAHSASAWGVVGINDADGAIQYVIDGKAMESATTRIVLERVAAPPPPAPDAAPAAPATPVQ